MGQPDEYKPTRVVLEVTVSRVFDEMKRLQEKHTEMGAMQLGPLELHTKIRAEKKSFSASYLFSDIGVDQRGATEYEHIAGKITMYIAALRDPTQVIDKLLRFYPGCTVREV